MPPVVVAERLTKYYGNRLAVRDVSFEVEAGQVLGLLGPNGSGKSTVLRILTGYLGPTSGSARVAGHDVATHSLEVRRRIGYVPEDIPLYASMFVDEFLRFMGSVKGVAGAGLTNAVDAVCARLALEPVRHVLIAKLSRGYRQRVAIAQALLGDPLLLVLDEPTSGLDPHQIIEMRRLIRELAQAHTIIVTSHILTEIEHVATHVAILLHGRLLTAQPLARSHAAARLRFELAGGRAADAQACALAVPGVTAVESSQDAAHAHGIELLANVCDPAVASALAAALVARGFALRRMEPVRSDLEALFLELTTTLEPDLRNAA